MKTNNCANKLTFKLLKLFSKEESISINALSSCHNIKYGDLTGLISYLISEEYLEVLPDYAIFQDSELTPDSPIRLTNKGRAFYEQLIWEHQKYIFTEVRLWIALLLSIVTFVYSFFSK